MSLNSFLTSTPVAYVCCFVAAVFFGSNYVAAKQFPTGDGVAFFWFMSLGILLVGYACVPLGGDAYWNYNGVMGGALWAIGNALVPTVIRFIGMGLGLLLWSVGNLLLGWITGKFGLFGVAKSSVETEWMNDVGVVCGVISLALFFFIKPTVEEEVVEEIKEGKALDSESGLINENAHGGDVSSGVVGCMQQQYSPCGSASWGWCLRSARVFFTE
eukprot:TRINITY_DN7243_c0_g1_i2.p1 TRINITY_DN7243_c0_g1~~TRINITY_DN7243_c0_g1_i2.p1  ORF type:complete len:215 (-),score=43.03 TRINITY_DN7243_c0_g1_i2:735-1379(-)